ncbi:MAG: hypothetical protein ACSHX6_11990 [Akkermansiaceae bacterium]
MKLACISLFTLLWSIAITLADHPYFPVSEKKQTVFTYIDGVAGGGIAESISQYTGETKEQEGMKYYLTKNWMLDKAGEKKYPTEGLARVDEEGNLYVINTGFKTEVLAMPSVSKLKEGYTWTSKIRGFEVTSKVVTLDGGVAIKGFNMDGLLVLEQTMGNGMKTKSYYKKGVGPVALATITKENEEKFMFHLKQAE